MSCHDGKSRLLFKLEMFLCWPFRRIYGHNVQKRFEGTGNAFSESLVALSSWAMDALSVIYTGRMFKRENQRD